MSWWSFVRISHKGVKKQRLNVQSQSNSVYCLWMNVVNGRFTPSGNDKTSSHIL